MGFAHASEAKKRLDLIEAPRGMAGPYRESSERPLRSGDLDSGWSVKNEHPASIRVDRPNDRKGADEKEELGRGLVLMHADAAHVRLVEERLMPSMSGSSRVTIPSSRDSTRRVDLTQLVAVQRGQSHRVATRKESA
jgi:hypothetical protein